MRAFRWVAVFAAAFLVACTAQDLPYGKQADAVVKVVLENGHGSGVHLGNGFILTATHVVSGVETVEIKDSTGEMREAEVLWTNKAYDVALLRVADPDQLGMSNLACRTPGVGEYITATGNPSSAEFITVWGRVGGSVREMGPWREVIVTDIATVPGQSGGPVYDENGDVVGLTVGVMSTRAGLAVSLVGVGYVVPASTVCSLLAKGI